MESKKSLFDPHRPDSELFDNFKKLVHVNHKHKKSKQIPLYCPSESSYVDNRDEFYNFVSIIIKPDDNRSLKEFLYNLYERLDFSFLLSYFSKEHPEELQGANLKSIMKLKELLDQVI